MELRGVFTKNGAAGAIVLAVAAMVFAAGWKAHDAVPAAEAAVPAALEAKIDRIDAKPRYGMRLAVVVAVLLFSQFVGCAHPQPPRVVISAWEACKQFCAPYPTASACVQGELRLGCECAIPASKEPANIP